MMTIDLLNIDGATIGTAVINSADPVVRAGIAATIGPGYDQKIDLPVPRHADPRCPYQLRIGVS